MKKKPNILVIMADQFRGDALSCMGHPDVKTPYLDSLASRGVLFENAYSACPSCIAARAGFHTGLKPENHKRVGYEDGIAWKYPHTIASEIKKAGYYAQAAGKMHVHPLRNLIGFDHVDLHDGYLHAARFQSVSYKESQKNADDYYHWLRCTLGADADVTDTGLECNSWISRPWCYDEKYHPTNWVTDKAVDFLRWKDPDKPFFLYTSYLKPHPPLDPPEYYYNMYMDMDLRMPAIGNWEDEGAFVNSPVLFDSKTGPKDKFEIKQMLAGYYGLITHLDHQIGKLIQALIEAEEYDNTIIIFTADHGEELGDHHLFRKSRAYEGSSHIPLIISAPESLIPGIKRGSKCKAVVELMDIMPTILDLAGAKCPDVDGVSLKDLLINPEQKVRDYLHGEHSYGPLSSHWIVTESDKYIWNSDSGKEEYFNLDVDPREMNECSASNTARTTQLRNILIKELKNRKEGFVKDGCLIAGVPYPPYIK